MDHNEKGFGVLACCRSSVHHSRPKPVHTAVFLAEDVLRKTRRAAFPTGEHDMILSLESAFLTLKGNNASLPPVVVWFFCDGLVAVACELGVNRVFVLSGIC